MLCAKRACSTHRQLLGGGDVFGALKEEGKVFCVFREEVSLIMMMAADTNDGGLGGSGDPMMGRTQKNPLCIGFFREQHRGLKCAFDLVVVVLFLSDDFHAVLTVTASSSTLSPNILTN